MIKIKNLVFSYSSKPVLDDVSLHAKKGEILCLLGPNGSGKTTLLKCLLGIHKETHGDIVIHDKNIHTYDYKGLAKKVSYVPQKQMSSFPYSVLDMVVMGRTCHLKTLASPKKKDYDIAKSSLDYLGMKDFVHRPFTELSGGESQLVMIARALTQESQCIVLDEPTAHLDYRNELVILEAIRMLLDKGHTIFMATHYPNHAYYFENHGLDTKVAFLNDGKIQFMGKPSDVLTEENLEQIYQIESKVLRHDQLKHVVPLYTKGSKS
ncbi:ABC transporter ATP-binding protein [Acidaminobacter sp. JC074]|uniref:ABC transporter ATP-binding protein n=1 Tax=Acidaminobacter sp. JC074 TaxID=2530199 RepID=UPI001F0E6686|nr:ABC transporter ATP-binding protein [Acidaminobacter sp. JC074]